MRTDDSEPRPGTDPAQPRPHTGRRRNDDVRRAILAAAMRLLRGGGEAAGPVTVDAIAREAGVGKQTIYRWWPSKGAVLLEALTSHADDVVPETDVGNVRTDLTAFVTASFAGAAANDTAPVLAKLAREAAHDAHLAAMMGEFTEARRNALLALPRRGRDRGELAADADLGLMVDQVFGVLWYRLLVGHTELTPGAATRLAETLVRGNAGNAGNAGNTGDTGDA
ncbi:TetR/AcrR family transcriptional regulator [Yinghuangia aomiensis]